MLGILLKERTAAVGDRKTLFEGLMSKNYRQAFSLAFRLTGNINEAEDLVQETFIRAYRFFHRYDETLPFPNWLFRILTNAHIDLIRRKSRLKTSSLEQQTAFGIATLEIPDNDAPPDRGLINNAISTEVQSALLTMTPEFRTAVLLADVEGMAYEEIAETMNTSVGTVRSRIHRGRKQLRKFLVKNDPARYGGW